MDWKDTLKKNYATTVLVTDFIDFLEYGNYANPFLKLTSKGIEVREPLKVREMPDEDAGYAVLKQGEVLVGGIPFATYGREIIKRTNKVSDSMIQDIPMSLYDAEEVIYAFFTKKPEELKKFYEHLRHNGYNDFGIQLIQENIFDARK